MVWADDADRARGIKSRRQRSIRIELIIFRRPRLCRLFRYYLEYYLASIWAPIVPRIAAIHLIVSPNLLIKAFHHLEMGIKFHRLQRANITVHAKLTKGLGGSHKRTQISSDRLCESSEFCGSLASDLPQAPWRGRAEWVGRICLFPLVFSPNRIKTQLPSSQKWSHIGRWSPAASLPTSVRTFLPNPPAPPHPAGRRLAKTNRRIFVRLCQVLGTPAKTSSPWKHEPYFHRYWKSIAENRADHAGVALLDTP